MNLTQRQEWMIARYLRDVASALSEGAGSVREQDLARVNARIFRELEEISSVSGHLRDDDVLTVLDGMGTPGRLAKTILESRGADGGLALAVEDRKWLGVCGGLARHFGIGAQWVRAVFLALGITGPIAIVVYIGLYFEMYPHSNRARLPRPDTNKVVMRFLAAAAAVISFHVGARLLLWGIEETHNRLAETGSLGGLGKWDWLRANTSFFLFCALVNLVPLAALSGLPLPEEWSDTLKRVVQAGMVVYAFVLSFGVAAFLAGVILYTVKEMGM